MIKFFECCISVLFSDIDECSGWLNTACSDYNAARPENSDVFCHNTQVSTHYLIHTLCYIDLCNIGHVIIYFKGSFWCEVKQNPREAAVWRDFVWTPTLHYG